MPLTRTMHVEGRQICVYDNLVALPHIKQLTEAFLGANFVRDEVARQDTAQFRHWELNIPLETATQLVVHQPTLSAVSEDFPGGSSYRLYRCYCNHAAYGDMLFTHTDTPPGEKGLTALWYIAPEWDVEWGGETLFYNAHHDAEAVVTPKPGRLVVFDGSIVHVGRPPNRICFAPRYTLAFKLGPPAG
jgi:Rps23 Pro-64 3,4-dihydroxylase Tpa1-like proline 4-hydroxylase